jgi:hypothetical protein
MNAVVLLTSLKFLIGGHFENILERALHQGYLTLRHETLCKSRAYRLELICTKYGVVVEVIVNVISILKGGT